MARKSSAPRARARSRRAKHKRAGVTVRAGNRTLSLETAKIRSARKPKSTQTGARSARGAVEAGAIKLIDLAADLLKTGVQVTTRSGAEGRRLIKRKASSAVSAAANRLNAVVRQGSRLAHRGINQI